MSKQFLMLNLAWYMLPLYSEAMLCWVSLQTWRYVNYCLMWTDQHLFNETQKEGHIHKRKNSQVKGAFGPTFDSMIDNGLTAVLSIFGGLAGSASTLLLHLEFPTVLPEPSEVICQTCARIQHAVAIKAYYTTVQSFQAWCRKGWDVWGSFGALKPSLSREDEIALKLHWANDKGFQEDFFIDSPFWINNEPSDAGAVLWWQYKHIPLVRMQLI